MTTGDAFLEGAETAEDLFEDAPCGYLATTPDGHIVRVNRTFERWTGFDRDELAERRFPDLLTGGGRIYHETHFAPLLRMQGWVREIALDIRRAEGPPLPALVNAVLHEDDGGRPALVRMTVFDATDRRRYEQELLRTRERDRSIALELQRSLLAGALPEHPHLGLEVVYRPAERGTEVGGDWYDAFWVDGRDVVAFSVGDVVGRGLGAAATMGQLRSAVRALAATGLSPARLLETLDRYADRHEVGEMATVAYAELDLRTATMRLACAGHPPPVILDPGGSGRVAWEGRSPPVAVRAPGRERPEATLSLQPGTKVLLFTDGLFERADRAPDAALDDVRHVAAAAQNLPLGELTRHVVTEMLRGEGAGDDVCLLAFAFRARAAGSAPGSLTAR